MGFPTICCQKALLATGNRDPELLQQRSRSLKIFRHRRRLLLRSSLKRQIELPWLIKTWTF